ncbi:hypothetical protein C8N28_1297 [Albibacterium bauzanense]|uniref:Transposase IS200 family protein n=1 Tax=Albibacterium bauzanense TaxID=653929 RepID=A0A4R1LV28_9SPHI|nr:hypothetical protein C8N28_1297 [Albibacterium bauzanense]
MFLCGLKKHNYHNHQETYAQVKFYVHKVPFYKIRYVCAEKFQALLCKHVDTR